MAVRVLKRKSATGAKFEAPDGGWVKLRLISGAEFKEIRKQTVTVGVEYPKLDGKFQRFEVEKVDQDRQNELFWDACIEDFGDWADESGTVYPVTRENKVLLMTEFEEFASLVNDGIQKLTEDKHQQDAALD